MKKDHEIDELDRGYIKEVNEKRFNEKFWKIGDAYSIRSSNRYVDAILCEIIKDRHGITRLRFVTGVTIPGYSSNAFGISVCTWQEKKLACLCGTHIDHVIEPGEELSDVSFKVFDEEWFKKEADNYIDFESTVITKTLIRVDFRGSTMIGFVDPRQIQDYAFELYVGPNSITICPTPEEMDSIKIYPLKPLKEENNE